MNCSLLCFLFLGLWAELVTGRVLPINNEARSIAEDLLKALQSYSRELQNTTMIEEPYLPKCDESPVPWSKMSEVADRLLQKQTCAEELRRFVRVNDCPVIMLNQELLQHLGGPDSTECLTSSTSSSLLITLTPEFEILSKYMQCIKCWSQQVKELLS